MYMIAGLGQTPGNINRQRIMAAELRRSKRRAAQRTPPPPPPGIMELAADRRRREEARQKTSAMLRRMFAPTFRPGAGQRAVDPSRRGRQQLSSRAQRRENEMIRNRARAIARSRWEPEVRRRIAEVQAEGLRRSQRLGPPPIETIPVIETTPAIETAPALQLRDRLPAPVPIMITTQATPETLDIARQEAATRQSTADLQRLVNARRALGIR